MPSHSVGCFYFEKKKEMIIQKRSGAFCQRSSGQTLHTDIAQRLLRFGPFITLRSESASRHALAYNKSKQTLTIYIISGMFLAFWSVYTCSQLEGRRIYFVINIFHFRCIYYIKQMGSMLQCVCSVIDHRRYNVLRTSLTPSAIASWAKDALLSYKNRVKTQAILHAVW